MRGVIVTIHCRVGEVIPKFIFLIPPISTDSFKICDLQVLQRKIPMAWGTTTDRVTVEINPFPYARETKYLTLKDLETYLIPDV